MEAGEPHLNDREIASVIRRAAELQDQADEVGPRRGTPLGVVREIAVDVGLDPSYVDEAAGTVLGNRRSRGGPLMGAPVRETIVATSRRALSEAATRDLLARLENALDRTGTITASLGVTTWTAGDLSLAITADARGTKVRVSSDRASSLAPTVAVPLAAGITAAGAIVDSLQPGSLEALMILGSGAVGGLGVARAVWGASTRRLRDRIQRVLTEVRRATSATDHGAAGGSSSAVPSPSEPISPAVERMPDRIPDE